MKTAFKLLCIFLTLLSVSCSKISTGAVGDTYITFYVKDEAKVESKSLIDDTDALKEQRPPIYVTDESEVSPAFRDEPVYYNANGVWKSEAQWQSGKSYVFYAYVSSPGNASGAALSPSNGGKTVTVSQPSAYSDDDNAYSDYLMSYRVSANGSEKPLVRLDLERITTGVELYMSRSANMTEVILEEARFESILTKALFSMSYHATSAEAAQGRSNSWMVSVDETSRKDYSGGAGISLAEYSDVSGRFAEANRVMKFLTVQQSLTEDDNALLYVRYKVNENGNYVVYEHTFNLSDYPVKSWSMGHKVRYFISVDTNIKLEGVVQEWKSVDFIESTFLPN